MINKQKITAGAFATFFIVALIVEMASLNNSHAAVTATFALSPSSGSHDVGETFNVNIDLNTNGNTSSGAEVYVNYDTSLLEVQDSNSGATGTQIQAGSLYGQSMTNSVSSGRISFSQVNSGGTFYNGSGTFATISFRAVAAGTASVTIDHTLGNTTDSNVEGEEGDILSSVTNASFTLSQPVDSTAPTISSVSSSSVTTSGATISWSTNEASTSQVEYGTTTNYGSSTTLDSTQVTSHSVSLSGLSASTTYHYRVKSQDVAGNLATSSDGTFTTSTPVDTTPPIISSVAISAKDQSAAVIVWTTSESSTSQVEYGTTTNYGSSTTLDSSLVTSHQSSIGGLSASTTYHYRVKSQDVAGNLATSSDDVFTTDSAPAPDSTPPSVSNVRVISKDASAVVIGWTTDEMSTSQIEYGTTATYGSSTKADTNRVLEHQVSIGGLNANTTYHYRVLSKDGTGNEAKSEDGTFITSESGVVPEVTVDTVAPAPVKDLAVSEASDTSVILTWTAVGDDDAVGTAASYEARYSTTEITSKNWAKATKIGGVAKPAASGAKEKMAVKSLKPETKYYFAIKVSDEKPNASGLSNVVSATTLKIGQAVDSVAPAKVTNLISSIDEDKKQILISWSNPQDADFVKVVLVRKEKAEPVNKDDGQVVYEGTDTSFVDANITTGVTYYYKAFAADEIPNYSEGVNITGVLPSLITIDTVPPKAPRNFKADFENNKVDLSWTNPTDKDFDKVVLKKGDTESPKDPKQGESVYQGNAEKFTDSSVVKNKTYHYSIFSVDKESNYSKPAVVSVKTKSSSTGLVLGILLVVILGVGGGVYWRLFYKQKPQDPPMVNSSGVSDQDTLNK